MPGSTVAVGLGHRQSAGGSEAEAQRDHVQRPNQCMCCKWPAASSLEYPE